VPVVEMICKQKKKGKKRQPENIPAAAFQLQSHKEGPTKKKTLYQQI